MTEVQGPDNAPAIEDVRLYAEEHGLLVTILRLCRKPDGGTWADAPAILRSAVSELERVQINYVGPDPSVECCYPTCTNRLRRSDFGDFGPQFCCKEHRDGR